MIDLTPAADAVAGLLDGISILDDPTPCDGFTVADLLDHLDEVARGFTALARGVEEAAPARGPWADPERRAALGADLRELAVAWSTPTVWEGVTAGPGVELPNALWGRIAATEVVVHGWDLARATGQRLAVPDDVLRPVLDHVVDFVPNAPIPSLWGTPTTLPADAELIDRVVAATGRTP